MLFGIVTCPLDVSVLVILFLYVVMKIECFALMSMTDLLLLEISATALGLIFLVLLIKENIWCWFFGAISSILSIILFYKTQLYSEAILYFYYVIIAGYGYHLWSSAGRGKGELRISDNPLKKNVLYTVIAGSLGLLLGYFFDRNTNADQPYLDAQTTMFSFLASYLEAHKILSGWIFWIVINAVTIGLYTYKGLYFYTALMVVYLILSFIGYFMWRRNLAA